MGSFNIYSILSHFVMYNSTYIVHLIKDIDWNCTYPDSGRKSKRQSRVQTRCVVRLIFHSNGFTPATPRKSLLGSPLDSRLALVPDTPDALESDR